MTAKVNKTVLLHQGPVFRLMHESITLANGVNTAIDVIRHPGASAIVPLLDNDGVLLIRQYRHAVGNFIWEVPAGTLDYGERPIDCARRELIEETGFTPNTLVKLGEITPVPGYSDERVHIFLAEGLQTAQQALDRDELLSVHQFDFEDVLTMIHQGVIKDAKTICALMMANHWKSAGPGALL
jgi:ADP-ribose pyrophosphatase